MRILLTFAGVRDPFNPDDLVAGKASDGPVLTLLAEERFQRVYVFSDERLLGNARKLLGEITVRRAATRVKIVEVALPDPTDYEEIFSELLRTTRVLLKHHGRHRAEYFISIASGTPQMSTVWFLLAQSRLVPATLLKVTPRRFLKPGQRAVSEVRLSLKDFPKITAPTASAVELASLRLHKEKLEAEREALFDDITADGIVGTSKPLRDALHLLKKASVTDHSILILGESGTGKELFAHAAHAWSARRNGAFIKVNCAAIPETLIETELFGHEKGAFTGAIAPRKGAFELAHDGTLFLDEIGELPLNAQAKLLRAVEQGELDKVGATQPTRVDVRVIAATNRDLKQALATKTFRDDLYYRLSAIEVSIPPLRERREDISLLLEHYLGRSPRNASGPIKLSADSLRVLLDYSWPGNVRELENVVTRITTFPTTSVIAKDELPKEVLLGQAEVVAEPITIPSRGMDLEAYLARLAMAYYRTAVQQCSGNRAAAARLLGIEPATFRKQWRQASDPNGGAIEKLRRLTRVTSRRK